MSTSLSRPGRSLTLLCPGAIATASLPARYSLRARWPRGWRHAELLERDQDTSLVARELPHESWLRASFGLPADDAVDASAAAVDGVSLPALRLTPVHLHTGRDHLVLTDPRQLELSEDDSRSLIAAIQPLLDESGLRLTTAGPLRWYLTPTVPGGSLPQAPVHGWRLAAGRSIDAYVSRDPASRPWRRLINEIQMTWYEHPVNQAREQRRLLPINSLWLEGRASGKGLPATASTLLASDDPAVQGLGRLAGLPDDATPALQNLSAWLHQAPASRRPAADHVIAVIDFWDPIGSEGQADVFDQAWLRFNAWLADAGLDNGPAAGFDRLRIVLTGERSSATLAVGRHAAWRFWRNPDPDSWLERFETAEPPAAPVT